jgi:hypothetical protein
MRTIKEGFENFMKLCHPTVAKDSSQYIQSRIVFHAGAIYFGVLIGESVKGPDGKAEIRKLMDELHEFVHEQETVSELAKEFMR